MTYLFERYHDVAMNLVNDSKTAYQISVFLLTICKFLSAFNISD